MANVKMDFQDPLKTVDAPSVEKKATLVYITATAENRVLSVHLTAAEAMQFALRLNAEHIYVAERGRAIFANTDRIIIKNVREIPYPSLLNETPKPQ
jgi:hypothetical protein